MQEARPALGRGALRPRRRAPQLLKDAMKTCLSFGWVLRHGEIQAWQERTSGHGAPTPAEQAAAAALFPAGVWLTRGFDPADPAERCYAITLLPPGTTGVSISDLLDIPIERIDEARRVVWTIRQLLEHNDPVLRPQLQEYFYPHPPAFSGSE